MTELTLTAPLPAYAGTDDQELMRNRILAAAARLFSQKGFRGTTTRAISEVVGILSGSLFHYFKNKDQMLYEVMYEASAAVCTRGEAVVAAASDPRLQLRGLIRLQLECMLSERTRDFYAVLISEWNELSAESQARLSVLQKRHFRNWDRVLKSCEAQQLLRGEARTSRLALLGSIHWANTWFRSDGRLSVEQYADFLERLVIEDSRPTGA